MESESIAENCRSRLQEQGVPFYRFSPYLSEIIPAGETDTEKLVDVIMRTRVETAGPTMDELAQMLHFVWEMTVKMRARKRCDSRAARLRYGTLVWTTTDIYMIVLLLYQLFWLFHLLYIDYMCIIFSVTFHYAGQYGVVVILQGQKPL